MTERELILHAKDYIDCLASGINPLDGTKVKDDDVVNNIRISRCLFYVSNVLQKVVNGDYKRATALPEFSITKEQLDKFNYSLFPISISEIGKRVTALASDDMKKFSYYYILNWLQDNEYIKVVLDENGKNKKVPTEKGRALGLLTEDKESAGGRKYQMILYNNPAQHFIIERIPEMIEYAKIRENQKSVTE